MPRERKIGAAKAALERNRSVALEFADRAGKKRTLELLRQAQASLERRLGAAEQLKDSEAKFTVQRMRIAVEQVKLVTRQLSAGLRDHLVASARPLSDRAVEDLTRHMRDAEKSFRGIGASLPLKPALMMDRVAKKTEASVLGRIVADPKHPGRPGVLERYGADVVSRFEDRMQLGFAAEERWGDVRAGIIEESDFLRGAPKSWAERIIRTESMAAYNRASFEGVREAQAELGDCVKILAASFDDRTSWDSYQVHGQIRRPEEPFEWSKGSFMYPPNRPNDRETVVTWRLSWPLEAELEPRSDGEVEARYREENPKGPGPGPRPNMSTVDRSLFGKVEAPKVEPEEAEREEVVAPEFGREERLERPIAPERLPSFRSDRDRGNYALRRLGERPRYEYGEEWGRGEFDAIANPIPSFSSDVAGYANPPWSEAKQTRIDQLSERLHKLEAKGEAPAPRMVRISQLQSLTPDLLRVNVMRGVGEAFFGQKGDVPLVVRSNRRLYVYENAERVAATKLGGRKQVVAHVVDLDAAKPWKERAAPPKLKNEKKKGKKAPPIPIAFQTPAEFASSYYGGRELEEVVKKVFQSDQVPTVKSLEKVWGSEEAGHRIEIRDVTGYDAGYGEKHITMQGKILNKNGVTIGNITRTFKRHADGKFEVHHDYFKIDDEREQGKGSGSGMLRQSIQTYEKLGVDFISVDAAWVGRYAWATFGFNWNAAKAADMRVRFRKYLELKGIESGRAEKVARKVCKKAWEMAAVDLDGITSNVFSEGKRYDMKLGKSFFLEHTRAGSGEMWSGILRLDDKNHETYKRAEERIGL